MKSTDKKFTQILSIGSTSIYKKLSLLFILIFFNTTLTAQTVITGKASSYAGDNLKIYTVRDFITLTPDTIAIAKVDEQGNFSVSVNLKSTERIYFDLPQVQAFMYVEPNKKYDIRLPKKQQLTIEQRLNPYFSKDVIPAYIVNIDTSDINYKIAVFDRFFGSLQNKILPIDNDKKKLAILDSAKKKIDSVQNNKFLYNFEFYNLALLHYYAFHYQPSFYIDTFLEKTSVCFCPAYFKFFYTLFNNFFSPDNSPLDLRKVATGLRDSNFTEIRNAVIEKYPKLDIQVANLLAIKGMYDLFYDNDYYQKQIIKTLENIDTSISDSLTLKITQNFYQKVTKLRKGYPAPDFNILNTRKRYTSLKKFKGSFVYLNFFNPHSIACQQILPFLEKYYNNKIADLQIVTVYVGNNFDEMKTFLKQHKEYKWTFLFADFNNKIIKDYQISSYPSFFLINPDGTLAVQETPSPLDNFEQVYNKAYKQWKKKHYSRLY